MEHILPVLMIASGLVWLVITLWGGYYLHTGLMSWRKPLDYGWHPARTRFAVLIAARNEELVIGPLINSLLTQDYPSELYDVWVIPNNCTDNTAQRAREAGAIVFEHNDDDPKHKRVSYGARARSCALPISVSAAATTMPTVSLMRTTWWTAGF